MRPTTLPRAMETLLDRFKREQGGLRRSRSVRASLRLIGNRLRSSKDEEPPDDIEKLKRNSVVFTTQIWNTEKDFDVAFKGVEGTYKSKTPTMAKRKPDPVKPRRKSGDIDLNLKPHKHGKVEKSKFSDFFSNKKLKSASAKELLVPEKIPPKAAALLHIHSPEKKEEKGKKKSKGMVKSESAKAMLDGVPLRRVRRGSESDMSCDEPRGCVNRAFVYSTPPKDRKLPKSPSAYLSTYCFCYSLLAFITKIMSRDCILV